LVFIQSGVKTENLATVSRKICQIFWKNCIWRHVESLVRSLVMTFLQIFCRVSHGEKQSKTSQHLANTEQSIIEVAKGPFRGQSVL